MKKLFIKKSFRLAVSKDVYDFVNKKKVDDNFRTHDDVLRIYLGLIDVE